MDYVIDLLRAVELDLMGEATPARRAYRKLARNADVRGPSADAWLAIVLNNLAVGEAAKGRFERAVVHLERAWRLNDGLGDSVSVLVNLCNLATVHGASGSVSNSSRYRRKAMKAWVAIGERDLSPHEGFVAGNLSRLMDMDAWMMAEDDSLKRTPPPLPRLDTGRAVPPVKNLDTYSDLPDVMPELVDPDDSIDVVFADED